MSTDALAVGIGDLVAIEWVGTTHATVIGVAPEGKWVVVFGTLFGTQFMMLPTSAMTVVESARSRATALATEEGK